MQRTDQPTGNSSPAPSRLAAALSDGDNAARVPLAQQVRARTTVAAVEEHNAAVAERRARR